MLFFLKFVFSYIASNLVNNVEKEKELIEEK
jgi:hypothetical protein